MSQTKDPTGQYMPMVIEAFRGQERGYDIFSRLLKDRIIFLGGGPIVSTTADLIVGQLLFLDADNPEEEITMYINSPGGEVNAGLAIVDTMNLIRPPVHTKVVGQAASMGAFILACGEKGYRSGLPNAEIMIHQVMGGASGQASDIKIEADRIIKMKEKLNRTLAQCTGQTYERICADTERNTYLSTEDAVSYGLVDYVESRK